MSDQDLPRRRDPSLLHSLASNPKNGVFVIIDVPPSTGSVTMAVDGFLSAADLAMGKRTRIAEFSAPVFADSVVIIDADPKRQ